MLSVPSNDNKDSGDIDSINWNVIYGSDRRMTSASKTIGWIVKVFHENAEAASTYKQV